MTLINVSAAIAALTGSVVVEAGRVTISYHRGVDAEPAVRASGARVNLPAPIIVPIASGETVAPVDVPPTDGTCYARLTVEATVPYVQDRFVLTSVAIPVTGPVDITALVAVDPASFEPITTVVTAWQLAVDQVAAMRTEVASKTSQAVEAAADAGTFAGATEFDANRAGQSAFQAGQSAASALGHKNDAKTSADAAAASAASIVKDVPGGVPTLDGNARVPDARLPERLSAPQLNASLTAIRRPGINAFRGLAPVADIGQFGDNLSNGSDTQQMTRASYFATRAMNQISVAYLSWRWNGIAEDVLTATVTIRASVEYNGVILPVFFNGKRDVVMEPESIVQSDPISFEVPAGGTFFIRTFATATAGTFPANRILNNVVRPGEGVESGTSGITDKTLSGTVATTAARGFVPTYVLADPQLQSPVIAAIGDSIVYGNGDSGIGGTTDRGFVSRAFSGSGKSMMKIAAPGDKPSLFKLWTNSRRRRNLVAGATHVLWYEGINGLRSGEGFAAVQADTLLIWSWLAAQGIKVYACTIGPRATTTDNFVTVGNQTVDTYNADRVAFNDWIRTTPAPLSGYFEVADTMESARNSGKWKVTGAANYATADGLHPSTPIHQLMAAAITPATFVL